MAEDWMKWLNEGERETLRTGMNYGSLARSLAALRALVAEKDKALGKYGEHDRIELGCRFGHAGLYSRGRPLLAVVESKCVCGYDKARGLNEADMLERLE